MVRKGMMMRWTLPLFSLALAHVSCGGASAEAESPPSGENGAASSPDTSEPAEATSANEEEGPASGPWNIPTKCHDGDRPCTANPKWVKKLCEDVYPAVALYVFSKSSPFTHGYLSRKTRAVNASGGATSGDEWLAFDEEVVLLHHRAADLGGMQVSGAGSSYEAMRLDGSCVTLGSDEVRLDVPPAPKYAKVPWRYIGDDMQDALREVPAVRDAYIARRQECKGAFSGSVSQKCVQKDEALNAAIIRAVVGGEVELPQPSLRP